LDSLQAARALANLAAHGDSNGNNAAVGREAGALEALVHLTCSNHEGVRYVEFCVILQLLSQKAEVFTLSRNCFSNFPFFFPAFTTIADKKRLELCGIFLLMIGTGRLLQERAVLRHW